MLAMDSWGYTLIKVDDSHPIVFRIKFQFTIFEVIGLSFYAIYLYPVYVQEE